MRPTILNPLLALFGRKIVPRYIGHWSGSPLSRELWQIGWRFARASEPDEQTELDRLIARSKEPQNE